MECLRGEESQATGSGRPSLAIVGGGLAGLAAAATAVKRGFRVEIFEQARSLGGRAGSFVDSKTGERIDYCRHVAMGCCSAFLDFCRHTHIDDCFQQSSTLHFIAPDGRQYDFARSQWLPAPLHLLPGFWNLKYLTLGERLGIAQAMRKLVAHSVSESCSDTETIGEWLRRYRQSDRVIEQFWSVILVSVTGETVDRIALSVAQMIFREGFFASRTASDLFMPRMPLSEIFHDRLGRWLRERGVAIHCQTPVRRIEGDSDRVSSVVLADGSRHAFDFVVAATPWLKIQSLLAENILAAVPALKNVDRIEPAAITAVHFWFDRPVTSLPHAALVGRLGQWIFPDDCASSKIPARQHCEVLISGSHRVEPRSHDAWIEDIRKELAAMWPQAFAEAKLLHARVITQPSAVFSTAPETTQFRPPQQTPIKNFALAGDWTATAWPATMESAVRSGCLAVDALRPL